MIGSCCQNCCARKGSGTSLPSPAGQAPSQGHPLLSSPTSTASVLKPPVSQAGAASSAGRAAAQEDLLSVCLSLPGLASPGSNTLAFLLASPPGHAAAVLVSRLAGDGGFTCPWSEALVCLEERGVQGQGEWSGDVHLVWIQQCPGSSRVNK